MGSEDYEIYKALRQEKVQEGASRRAHSAQQFERAQHIAAHAGMTLVQHTEVHYTLHNPKEGWLLNIYPGNRRLYHDRHYKKPPFLKIKPDWNLIDVVEAAIAASSQQGINGFAHEVEQRASQPAPKYVPTTEDIRIRAYYLWEAAGRPKCDGKDFWYRAEAEMRGQ